MEIVIYLKDNEIQIKRNDEVIVDSNYLFTKKKFVKYGRITDYEIFIDYMLFLIKKYKIKKNEVVFILNINNEQIDKLVLTETMEKVGFKSIDFKEITSLFDIDLEENTQIINCCINHLEIMRYRDNKLITSFIIPKEIINILLPEILSNKFKNIILGEIKLYKISNTLMFENPEFYLINKI